MAAGSCAFAYLHGDTPDERHAWGLCDGNRPNPPKVEAPAGGKPPSDAVVLFDGTRESFEKNWCDGKGEASKWRLGEEGEFYCAPGYVNGGSIRTREGFGDCQLHLEFRHDADIKGGGQMRGNSGVFIMGMHEIQVLESYGTNPADMKNPNYADGQCGAVYAENPPMVNACRKPGEWQTYDIVFHQPVWEGKTLKRPGSMTVFHNGVLVQDHWEMEGLTTSSHRRRLAPYPKKAPLSLQDHGCVVRYRNIWIRELPSRYDNTTHGGPAANFEDVMKLRRETAAKLYGRIKPEDALWKRLNALMEVIAYAKDDKYMEAYGKAGAEYKAKLEGMGEAELEKEKDGIMRTYRSFDVLLRNKVIEGPTELSKLVDGIVERRGWDPRRRKKK